MKSKNIMVKALLTGTMAVSLVFAGCGSSAASSDGASSDAGAQEETQETADVAESADSESADVMMVGDNSANPWVETTPDEIMEKIGLELAVPEGAEDVIYLMNEGEGIEEMQFTLDGAEYVARVAADGAIEVGDISGYNYAWENEEEGEVSGLSAVIKSATDGDQQVRVINWVDVVPGLSFSLATTGSDLDGLDIEVIAEQVYVCVQGDD